MEGYKRVIATIYEPQNYFERCVTLMKRMPRNANSHRSISARQIKAFF